MIRNKKILNKNVNILSILIVLSLITFFSNDMYADNKSHLSRIAVLNFKMFSHESVDADWMKEGIADLVQIELQNFDVVTLDRDLIRIVLSEQDLAESGLTSNKERIHVGRLSGAELLLDGQVHITQDKCFRIDATITSVDETRILSKASKEGIYPKDFLKSIGTIVTELIEGLGKKQITTMDSNNIPKANSPEVLSLFYKGLDVCALGWPEEGLVWFLAAQQLDESFTPAKAWEYQAYKMCGFEKHAAIVKDELLKIQNNPTVIAVITDLSEKVDQRKVISFLLPVIVQDEKNQQNYPKIDAGSLKSALEQTALKNNQVRVFNASLLKDIAVEHDLRLSGRFDLTTAPRYDRWLATDGLIFSRLKILDNERYILTMQVRDPLTSEVFAQTKNEIKDLQEPQLSQMLSNLLKIWTHSQKIKQPKPLLEDNFVQAIPQDNSPAFQHLQRFLRTTRLPRLLNNLRLGKDVRETRLELFVIYGTHNRYGYNHLKHAQVEKTLLFDDIKPGEKNEAYWIYKAYYTWGDHYQLYSKKQGYDRLMEVINKYPDSLPVACSFYNHGLEAWETKQWSEAISSLKKALEGFRKHKVEEQDRRLLLLTHFMLGDSFARLDQIEQARKHLLFADQLIKEIGENSSKSMLSIPRLGINKHNDVFICFSPVLFFDCPAAVRCALNKLQGIETQDYYSLRIQAFALRDSIKKHTPKPGELEELENLLIRSIHLLAKKWRSEPAIDLLARLRCYSDEDLSPLWVLKSPPVSLSPDKFQPLVEEVAESLRIYLGLNNPKIINETDPGYIMSACNRIENLYLSAEMFEEARKAYDVLFSNKIPVEWGFDALTTIGRQGIDQASYEQKLSLLVKRLPKGEEDLPLGICFQAARRYEEWGNSDKALYYYRKVLLLFESTPVFLRYEASEPLKLKLSARYYMAKIFIACKQYEKAAEQLRDIVHNAAGQKFYLRADVYVDSKSTAAIDQLAFEALEQLRSSLE